MKSKYFSIALQFLILLSSILPFYPTSCNERKEEKSTTSASIPTDSIQHKASDTSDLMTNKIQYFADSNQTESIKESSLTQLLSVKNNFYKKTLRPGDNYSLIGYIIDNLDSLFSSLGAIILLLLIVVIFFKLFNQLITSIIINLICAIGLVLYNPMFLFGQILWGSYVMIAVLLTTIIFDLFTIRKSARQK